MATAALHGFGCLSLASRVGAHLTVAPLVAGGQADGENNNFSLMIIYIDNSSNKRILWLLEQTTTEQDNDL